LGIGGILECIKNFFEGDNLFGLFVDCFPNDTIGSFAKFLQDLEFSQDVGL
jgi:hypothetical protein